MNGYDNCGKIDVTSCDFSMWSIVENIVFRTQPKDLDHLKIIVEVIAPATNRLVSVGGITENELEYISSDYKHDVIICHFAPVSLACGLTD